MASEPCFFLGLVFVRLPSDAAVINGAKDFCSLERR